MWLTQEEQAALADNRAALWNRRTPLYENGEIPMEYCPGCRTRDNRIEALQAQVQDKDQRIAALLMEADSLRAELGMLRMGFQPQITSKSDEAHPEQPTQA